jgi:ABC-type Fe3+ transport system permease subunit
VPATLAAQIQALATQVFDASYITAMRPSIALGMAVVLAGAAGALFVERRWRRSRSTQPEAIQAKAARGWPRRHIRAFRSDILIGGRRDG